MSDIYNLVSKSSSFCYTMQLCMARHESLPGITPRGQEKIERLNRWMKNGDLTKTMIQSSYPLGDGPDGVAQFTLGLALELEREGFAVFLVGPRTTGVNHADYTFGSSYRITLNRTTHKSAVSFRKGHARDLMLAMRPQAVVFQEPFAGHAAHTLVSGTPKREDGTPIPATIVQFHAQAENLTPAIRAALFAIPRLRRLRYRPDRIVPVGLSDGYIKTVLGHADGLVAVSKATADFVKEKIYPQAGEIEIIGNGIATDILTPEGPKIGAWLDGRKTILFAGRHDERKGLRYLIEAFAAIPSERRQLLKLKITGEGKETKRLRRLVHAMGFDSQVEFLGRLDWQNSQKDIDLVRAYRTADVFTSPAIGGEGFGRTPLEALSCGTMVVATDINGYREVVGGREFAVMVPPYNPYALARALLNVLSLAEEVRTRKGMLGSKYVRDNFAWPIIAGQTATYYRQRIAAHGEQTSGMWDKAEEKNGNRRFLPRAADIFLSGRNEER